MDANRVHLEVLKIQKDQEALTLKQAEDSHKMMKDVSECQYFGTRSNMIYVVVHACGERLPRLRQERPYWVGSQLG